MKGIVHENIGTHHKLVRRICADSLASPDDFGKLKYLLASSYLIATKKIDGLQDHEDWLVDYLETVKLMGGTRATTMQSIQVHLSGAARSWMKKLPEGSIDSWETFEDLFVRNFRSTCKKPASIEQLRTCKQKPDESMRMYIQRWSIIKNSADNVFDERAIYAFVAGIRRRDLIEEVGRSNPRTIADLMDIANRWADGEDAVHNKRLRSPL
jgi:hypothetical protein